MSFFTVLLVIAYVLVCLFLIMVVLLQQGKGADLAGAFGGGGSQTSFGPRSSTNIMHRLTTISFVLFVILSLGLAIMSGKNRETSVITDETAEPVAAESTEQEAATPGGVEDEGSASSQDAVEESGAENAGAPAQAETEAPPQPDSAAEQEPSSSE